MARHYLDHASTSPIRPEVVAATLAWWRGANSALVDDEERGVAATVGAGDPGRIHAEGLNARVAVENARQAVAAFLGARPREVVFTSGATESIATAIWGAAERGTEIIVPAIEHSAVRSSAEALVEAGSRRVITVPVDGFGRVDPDTLIRNITPATALVNLQWGNHEVGTRQAIRAVAAACREREVLLHIDAAAGAGHDAIDFREMGADLISISAHKFGGPPGIGALLIRRGLRLRGLLRGGDQERARRAGFENVPGIIGLAAACTALSEQGDGGRSRLETESVETRRLTDRVLSAVPDLDGVQAYGDPADRLPHIVCLGIDGIEPQAVLLGLDQAGIAAHSGSACSSEALEPSPVLQAMGVDAHRSLRVSTGWNSTDADIDALLETLPAVIARLRKLASN